MAQESITLKGPDGAHSTATAVVSRPSPLRRTTLASIYAGAGVIGGVALIPVPILHLFTTWALPLIGILMAMRTMKRALAVTRIDGACPECGSEIHDYDRGGDDPAWQVCPRCGAKLAITLSTPIAPVRPAHG